MSSGGLPNLTLVQEVSHHTPLAGAKGYAHVCSGNSRAVTRTRDTYGDRECSLSQTQNAAQHPLR